MKKLALITLAAFALSASASTTATREMVTNFCANVAQTATNYTDSATNALAEAHIPWSIANYYNSATDYSLVLERNDGLGNYLAIRERGTGGDGPFLFKTYTSGRTTDATGYRPRFYVGEYTGNYFAYYYDVTNAVAALDTALRSAIASAAPADYSNVSNLAVTAVQPGDNVSVLANDAGYLTDFTETDPEWAAASPTITADIATNAADIAELQSTATFLYHIYSGSNAVFEVTNYNSETHIPTARLLSLTNGTEYAVVWAETNGLAAVATAATNYTDSAILAATNRYAVRAWSATTSGLGVDAPAETTWISTPTTVIAGGYEYTKTVTSAGQVWVLTANGMTTLGPDDQSYLDISSGSGDSLIKIEKTDSYLVGVAATNITVSGSTVTISVPVVSADHPYARYAASLASPVTWYKEEDENIPSDVTVTWSGSSGAWVCTITTSAAQGYFFFEFMQEGETKITLGGSLDVTNGIYFNGVKYVPTVSGTELKFIAE